MKVRFNIKKYFQVLGISLAVVAALAAAALGFDFAALNSDPAPAENTNTAEIERNAEKINVLLMGVDVDGLRTDAIMLAQYDVQQNEVNMLSIPRDTKMYIGNRYQKINAAHAFEKDGKIGGAEATVEAVSRITGVPIHYYVDFSFDAVAHVINELGPIEFTIPDLYGDGVGMVYDDPVQSLHINLPPGTYELDGQKAVWLMRYRHGNPDENGHFKGYVNGDADRVEMQHEFLKALVDQKVNAKLILKLPAIFKEVSKELKTNLTASDVIKYAKYLTGFSSANIHAYSLPGEYGDDDSNGSIWKINIEETQKLIQEVFGYDASGITVNNPDDPDAVTPPNCVTNENISDTPGVAGMNNETGEVYEKERYGGSTSSSSSTSGSSSGKSSSSGSSSSGSSSSGSSSSGSSSSKSSSSDSSSSGNSSSDSSSSGSSSSGSSSSSSSSSGSSSSGSSTSSSSSDEIESDSEVESNTDSESDTNIESDSDSGSDSSDELDSSDNE